MADDLTGVIEDGRQVVRQGDAAVAVLPSEVRHLVDALVEGTGKLADREA